MREVDFSPQWRCAYHAPFFCAERVRRQGDEIGIYELDERIEDTINARKRRVQSRTVWNACPRGT